MMKRVATPTWDALQDRRTRWLNVFGRLKPGVSPEQAKTRSSHGLRRIYRPTHNARVAANHTGSDARVYGLGTRPPSRGCGLFIHASDDETADAGVARGDRVDFIAGLFERRNLSLAKAFAEQRATALRAALGASRRRILTEQLVESSLLAAAGCLSGSYLLPS